MPDTFLKRTNTIDLFILQSSEPELIDDSWEQ